MFEGWACLTWIHILLCCVEHWLQVFDWSAVCGFQASLMSTIINLAQNFVGSNNLNLLQPLGQFGTRLHGGKDAASPRYIFTMLRCGSVFAPLVTAVCKTVTCSGFRLLCRKSELLGKLAPICMEIVMHSAFV